jgi:outer membrane protein assembly factor BamA
MMALVLLALLLIAGPAAAQPVERITEIRVHGNHTTPEADILGLSGLAIGEMATPERLAAAEAALRASRRFEGVEVRRRYASLSDPTAILVLLLVDERPGVSPGMPLPGPLTRLRLATMWVPVLGYADGYGFTYGVRFAFVDPLGPRTRVSVPLTWGGERRAGAALERRFEQGPLSTVSAGAATYRRVNPHYDTPDVRLELHGRVERTIARWLRSGAGIRIARVDFGAAEQRHTRAGVDVVADTRLDPSFPRNAIHATLGWDRLAFEEGHAGQWTADVRGYVATYGATVLALRAHLVESSAPLPPSEHALLGGSSTLRGYRTGHRAGDNLATASAELRVPLTSPLTIARLGVKAFIDVGTTWEATEPLRGQPFDRGIGGGVYAGVAAFLLTVDVAWAESGRARGHVGMGVTF